MRKRAIGLMLMLPLLAHAQELGFIEGVVKNSETMNTLSGANVLLVGTPWGTLSDTVGRFIMSNIPPGSYVLSVSFVGFDPQKRNIIVKGGEKLSVECVLTPIVLPGQEVIVTATQAKERETPATFSNLNRQQLAERYSVQDIPVLLSDLPSITYYS